MNKLSKTQQTILDLARRHGRAFWYSHTRNKVYIHGDNRAQITVVVHPTTIPKMIRAGLLVREVNPENPMLVCYVPVGKTQGCME